MKHLALRELDTPSLLFKPSSSFVWDCAYDSNTFCNLPSNILPSQSLQYHTHTPPFGCFCCQPPFVHFSDPYSWWEADLGEVQNTVTCRSYSVCHQEQQGRLDYLVQQPMPEHGLSGLIFMNRRTSGALKYRRATKTPWSGGYKMTIIYILYIFAVTWAAGGGGCLLQTVLLFSVIHCNAQHVCRFS